jgi:hypothetical protein
MTDHPDTIIIDGKEYPYHLPTITAGTDYNIHIEYKNGVTLVFTPNPAPHDMPKHVLRCELDDNDLRKFITHFEDILEARMGE